MNGAAQDRAERSIRVFSIEQLERAFAKALGDLTGTPYDVTIGKIAFESGAFSETIGLANIDMVITKANLNEAAF